MTGKDGGPRMFAWQIQKGIDLENEKAAAAAAAEGRAKTKRAAKEAERRRIREEEAARKAAEKAAHQARLLAEELARQGNEEERARQEAERLRLEKERRLAAVQAQVAKVARLRAEAQAAQAAAVTAREAAAGGSADQATRSLVGVGPEPAAVRAFYDAWAPAYAADMGAWGYAAPEAAAGMLRAELTAAARCGVAVGFGDAKWRRASGTREGEAVDAAGPVLDAGAGDGLSGVALAAAGFERLTAVDLSPGMLAGAAGRGCYTRLVEADLGARLPFADSSFGVASCVGVLRHLAPPLDEARASGSTRLQQHSALAELIRVVRSPNKTNLLAHGKGILE